MIDAAAIFSFIVNHAWQSALLAAVLAGLLALKGRLSAQTRHALAFAALIAAAALPLAMLLPGNNALLVSVSSLSGAREDLTQRAGPAARPDIVAAPSLQAASMQTAAPLAGAPQTDQSGDDPLLTDQLPADQLQADQLQTDRLRIDQSWTDQARTDQARTGRAALSGDGFIRQQGQSEAARVGAPKPLARIRADQAGAHASLTGEALRGAALRGFTALRTPAVVWSLLALWLAGAGALLIRTGFDIAAAERLRRRATPAELPSPLSHLVGPLDVRESEEAPGPMVAGLLRPAVILPKGFLERCDPQELLGLVEHERAHVERNDTQLALLQRVLTALLWWSPAMHWIAARVEEEREMACDEAAAVRVGDARAFARTLTDHAEARLFWGWPRLVVGATRGKSQLGRRVRRLLERAATGASPERLAPRIAAGALLAAVAAAALATPRLEAQESPAPPASPALPEPPATPPAFGAPPAPRAPEAPTPPAAPVAPRRDAALVRATERLKEAQEKAQHAREELNAKAAEMRHDPARADEVRKSAQALAMAERDIRNAARDVQHAAGSAHVRSQGADDASADAFRSAALALAGASGAGSAGGDFNFDFDVDPQAFAALDGVEGLQDLKNLKNLPAISIHANAGPHGRHESPLIVAARSGNKDMVRVLVEAGADVNAASRYDESPLMAAARSGDKDMVKLLLDHGADPNLAQAHIGTPLMAAVQAGNADIVRLLIKAGADVNADAPDDGTALTAAVRAGNVDIVRLLIDLGASINGAKDDGK
jgi:beta-lactamase regulating signal transducer with metallopeptidase domain